jgi:cation transport ATPase
MFFQVVSPTYHIPKPGRAAATLWAAIAADLGVSPIVIANALRLLRSVD